MENKFQIEGRNPVIEALTSGENIEKIYKSGTKVCNILHIFFKYLKDYNLATKTGGSYERSYCN